MKKNMNNSERSLLVSSSISSSAGAPPGPCVNLRIRLLLLFLLASLTACRSGPPYQVYVSNEASGDITIIDPVKLEATATVHLGKRPRGIHASSDGKLIFVTLSGSPYAPPGVDESKLPPPDRTADGIGVMDTSDNKVLRKLPSGSDPEQFGVRRDGKMIYVSNEDDHGLSFVNLDTAKVDKTVPTGDEPEGVTLTPDEKYVYVTSEVAGTVTVVDTQSGEVVKTIKVLLRPRNIVFSPDGSRAYVANENSGAISVIDTAKLEVVDTFKVDENLKTMGMAITRDGAHLFITTGRGKKLVFMDLPSGKVQAMLEVGDRPWGVALSPDEKMLFTANGSSNDTSVIDVATRAVVKKIKVGDKPWGVITLAR
jgi:YVTN family beta-propeller protein